MIETARNRVPRLDGALNLRDLGGYRTVDGRTVRWQTLYRSGTTHALTQADVAQLAAEGIRYAYDLRSNTERRDHPNRLRDIANLEYRCRDHDKLPGDIRRLLKSPDACAGDSHRIMVELYEKLPYDMSEAFRALFLQLVNGDVPLVFNCTAGKDRTGVAAALLLTALGVPRESVLEDYLLSGQFYDRSCELILNDGAVPLFSTLQRAVWEPLMRVHPEYLDAMFNRLQASDGSVARYLDAQLGIDETALDRLRFRLLDPAP